MVYTDGIYYIEWYQSDGYVNSHVSRSSSWPGSGSKGYTKRGDEEGYVVGNMQLSPDDAGFCKLSFIGFISGLTCPIVLLFLILEELLKKMTGVRTGSGNCLFGCELVLEE